MTNIPCLKPILPSLMGDLIRQKELVFNAVNTTYNGPLHIVFPELMAKNIKDLSAKIDQYGFEYKILCSHKPTKSNTLIKQARFMKTGIDVASKSELISALSAGFTGNNIGTTGVKNTDFLTLAILHNCLISIDSIEELKRLIAIRSNITDVPKTNILLRLSGIQNADRKMLQRNSRFGMTKEDIKASLELISSCKSLNFKGIHFHTDEQNGDVRAGYLESMLTMMEDFWKMGLEPTIIDVGGGFRRPRFEDSIQCEQFITSLEEAIINGTETHTWRGFPYGMQLNDKGRVTGRNNLMVHFIFKDFDETLDKMFLNSSLRGRRLCDIIAENDFEVMFEPGKSIYQLAGLTFMRVIETKKNAKGENLFVTEGNLYNLSIDFIDYLADPILISKDETSLEACSGYIIGNLCGEHDVIMKREICFPKTPKRGDLICFFDTAAYSSDFQDAAPHQHSLGSKLTAVQNSNQQWQLLSDNNYSPFLTE
ncbi:MAG: hypothetical protein AB7U85_06555 [Alphaproteobacteria bacterium]